MICGLHGFRADAMKLRRCDVYSLMFFGSPKKQVDSPSLCLGQHIRPSEEPVGKPYKGEKYKPHGELTVAQMAEPLQGACLPRAFCQVCLASLLAFRAESLLPLLHMFLNIPALYFSAFIGKLLLLAQISQ